MSPPSHRRVADRYQLEERLGLGGMGEVYRAFDEVLNRWVALKRLRPDRPLEDSARRRLEREARLVARLSHPSVVQLYDLVHWQGELWLVMELVRGRSLAELLGRGPLAEERALVLAEQICAGLAAAHEREMVHRDLKAENVLVQVDGHARILDFGLALEALGPEDEPLTGETELVGTRRSMAPEQLLGRPVDGRADLFSLGVLLYEVVTGESPFAAQNPVETSQRVLHHSPPPPEARNPHLDPALGRLIQQLLEKRPERRPQSAEAVARELAKIRAGWERGRDELDHTTGSHPPVTLPVDEVAEEPLASSAALSSGPQEGRELIAGSAVAESSAAGSSTDKSSAGGDPGPPRRALRPALGAALGSALVLAVVLGLLGLLGPSAGSSEVTDLAVAVTAPRMAAGAGPEGSPSGESSSPQASFLGSALRAAALETLAGLEGIAAYSTESLEAEPATAVAAGRMLAVDEILDAQVECAGQLCRATLSRLSGEDGRVLDVVSFEAPADAPALVRRAVLARLRDLYPHRRWTGPEVGELPPTAYGEFLELRGRVLQGRVDEEILEALEELRRRAPGFVELYLLEAQTARQRFALARDGTLQGRAEELLEEARRRAPGDVRVLLQRFDLAYDTGSWLQARALLEELEKLDPASPQVLRRRAELLAREGHAGEALEQMRRAARLRPSFSMRFNLALMEYRHGEIDAARRTLEAVVAQSPDSRLARSFLAQIELAAGDVERARDLYQQLVARAPGALELSNLGFAQLLLGDATGALESFRQAADLEPANAAIALNVADALALVGRQGESREAYAETLRLADDDPAAADWQRSSVRAQALAHLGRSREAVAAVQEALHQARGMPQARYEAALVYALVGDRTSALTNAEQALAGGVQPSWFYLPWLEQLRQDPELRDRFAGEALIPVPDAAAAAPSGPDR
ncbi:MAG: protein kinase [Acidobacteriota bacterium]|nr:protein kinase [Acidobacteriota bacterium]